MPFKKGQPRPEGAGRKLGRPQGSIGRRAQVAKDLVARLNFDPLENLLKIARKKRNPLDIRVDAMKAACKFVHPVLSTQHILAQADVNLGMTARIASAVLASPELSAMAETLSIALATAGDAVEAIPESHLISGPSAEDER
jgi:hypothetical protein